MDNINWAEFERELRQSEESSNPVDTAATSSNEIAQAEEISSQSASIEVEEGQVEVQTPVEDLKAKNNINQGRYSGSSWFEPMKNIRVQLIGAGGIGSYTAYALCRTSINALNIIDCDKLEPVNLAGQFYPIDYVNTQKVNALRSLIHNFCGYSTSIVLDMSRIESHNVASYVNGRWDVTILALDNMKTRKTVYAQWRKKYAGCSNALFIDGRMSAEIFQVFAIDGTNTEAMKKYEKEWLFDDAQAQSDVCSYKQTSFVGMMIGGYITSIVCNWVNNLSENNVPRDIPFMTEFDSRFGVLSHED